MDCPQLLLTTGLSIHIFALHPPYSSSGFFLFEFIVSSQVIDPWLPKEYVKSFLKGTSVDTFVRLIRRD